MLSQYISTKNNCFQREGCTLVAGGAGFIGSHLCDRLIQRGQEVICVDNLYTGRIENVRPLQNHRRFCFIKHDVREPLELRQPIGNIYNLACAASPRHYQRDPIGTLQTCILGAQNILDLARRKSAKVLQASTSEVYGDPQIHPQVEEYAGCVNPIGPRACYDEGKRAAETLFFDYHRIYGVPIKVARIFNTFGPRMLENDGRVVSNFIVQALRDLPLTMYGRGRQTRSLCYVDDLIDGLELLMASNHEITGPCNFGNPNEMTIAQIADLILELTGSRSPIAYEPLPQDDPKRRRPSIDKAATLFGWRPRISIESGLQTTIGYFALQLFSQERGAFAPAISAVKQRDWNSSAEFKNGGRLVVSPAQQH
jgi:UDP-glucuronate decarboxylase